jgi:long-chain acyl-CoA synthetase
VSGIELEKDPAEASMLFYTSGTTGRPKGVQLSWSNVVLSLCGMLGGELLPPPGAEDRILHEFPLSSLAGAWFGILYGPMFGCPTHIPREPQAAAETRAMVEPTVYLGHPRLWELEAADILSTPESEHRAHVVERGFGQMRLVFCGGAPLPARLVQQWHDWGIFIREQYGMTECGGIASIGTDDILRPGTAGKPLPTAEIRISEDGEILVRGPIVFHGYLNLPDATAETLDDDGWLHTGDLGELLDDGTLRMLDRKSDVLVLAGGEQVIVSPIEAELTKSLFVRHAVVVGQGFDALGALIELDQLQVRRWAAEHGHDFADAGYAELIANPLVERSVAEDVERANRALESAGNRGIIGFRFLPVELDLRDSRIMTATRKVRRRAVMQLNAALVDEIYAGVSAR